MKNTLILIFILAIFLSNTFAYANTSVNLHVNSKTNVSSNNQVTTSPKNRELKQNQLPASADKKHFSHQDAFNNYETELTKLLTSLSQITRVPSYSVAVVHKGKTVARVATGYANRAQKVKAKPDTIYRLASVSKVIGATMLAELVIDGKLDPDKPIVDYIPRIPKHYHKITVRQLLSHTSGMPHYQAKDYDIYDKHYVSALQAVSTLKSRRLLSEPGEEYKYSTHGYTLAGALYEKITEKPLSESIPKFVKRWSGKTTPLIENIHHLPANTSRLYAYASGRITPETFGEKSYSVFGAGLSATAEDLAHFGYAVLNKSAGNEKYQRLLFSPTTTNNGKLVVTSKYQVAFGWRKSEDSLGNTVYHHAGATPGARSILVLYPEQELSISILSNTSWVSGIDKMAHSLANLYLENAKPTSLSYLNKYQATYEQKSIEGKIRCEELNCFLGNESTAYTKWQNKYNDTGEYIDDWPIFAYTTTKGRRILMIGKTGIRTLFAEGDEYKAPIAPNKIYSLKLLNK